VPKLGSAVRVLGLAAAAVVVVAVGLGAITWMTRGSGPAERVVSAEGGLSVRVPRDWVVVKKHPTDPDHQDFLTGHENAAFGFVQRGGFWVSRWPASAATTLATLRADYRKDASVTPGRVGPYPATVERYHEPPRGLAKLCIGDTHLVVRELIVNGYVFQVGTWTLPHPGGTKGQLDELAQSLEIREPQPWRATHVTVPGGWVERPSDLKGARFFALAPGDPAQAWAYVFHYRDSPTASLHGALTAIPKHGGAIVAQRPDALGGRHATRVEFTFPDGRYGSAQDVEWFVGDGKGGTFVLAVGRRSGDEHIHDQIAHTWRF
jgi:hypothetical protein